MAECFFPAGLTIKKYCIKIQYMESPLALNNLLHRTDLWRGHRVEYRGEVRDTGFADLNQVLVGGGWPLKGLVEISYPQLGSGEWQLLSGTLQNFSDHPGYLVLVNPPALLCASALAQMGVPLQQVLIIRCGARTDVLAGVLEALRSGCARMLLFWEGKQTRPCQNLRAKTRQGENSRKSGVYTPVHEHFEWISNAVSPSAAVLTQPETLGYAELRKVQLAAAESDALCIMMRKSRQRGTHSPAVLRLELQSRLQGLQLHIRRQRGGLADVQVQLPWPQGWTLQPFDPALMQRHQQGTAGQVLPFQAQS